MSGISPGYSRTAVRQNQQRGRQTDSMADGGASRVADIQTAWQTAEPAAWQTASRKSLAKTDRQADRHSRAGEKNSPNTVQQTFTSPAVVAPALEDQTRCFTQTADRPTPLQDSLTRLRVSV